MFLPPPGLEPGSPNISVALFVSYRGVGVTRNQTEALGFGDQSSITKLPPRNSRQEFRGERPMAAGLEPAPPRGQG